MPSALEPLLPGYKWPPGFPFGNGKPSDASAFSAPPFAPAPRLAALRALPGRRQPVRNRDAGPGEKDAKVGSWGGWGGWGWGGLGLGGDGCKPTTIMPPVKCWRFFWWDAQYGAPKRGAKSNNKTMKKATKKRGGPKWNIDQPGCLGPRKAIASEKKGGPAPW